MDLDKNEKNPKPDMHLCRVIFSGLHGERTAPPELAACGEHGSQKKIQRTRNRATYHIKSAE
jgi:hypothetical protein